MKLIIFVIFALIAITCAFKDDADWKVYKKAHKKAYKDDAEEGKRYQHFKNNDAKIKAHNAKHKRGETKYTLGHNAFSDLSDEEFRKRLPVMTPPISPRALPSTYFSPELYPNGPDTVCYKAYSAAPLNQGQCGSCWAFATAAQVEIQQKIKDINFNNQISPQHLVDCVTGCNGCGGGWPTIAMQYIKDNGFTNLTLYPYNDPPSQKTCQSVQTLPQTISTVNQFNLGGNEDYLKNVVAAEGPVAIAMFANSNFKLYKAGIYEDETCDNTCAKVNHGMVVVGYGTDLSSSSGYFTVKNSWGTSWGESGYARFAKSKAGSNNVCNIACYAMFTT